MRASVACLVPSPDPVHAGFGIRRTMAYDQQFLRVTFGFTVLNSLEIAQTGLNFSGPDEPLWDAPAAEAEIVIGTLGPLLLTRLTTLMGNANLRWADYSRLNYVRIAAVNIDGTEDDGALVFEDSTPAVGVATQVIPQASLVLSTRSGVVTGSANFGRMYLPHTAPLLGAVSPVLAGATTAALATAAQVFVNGCNTDMNAAITQNVSAMIMTQVLGGVSKKINQVAIGNVIDTQRRRRNQLPETYAFAAVP